MATVSNQLSQIRTRIKKDPNAKIISDAQLLVFLNEAQDILEQEVIFPNAQTTEQISTTASTQSYSLDSQWRKSLIFRYDANDQVLWEIPFLALQKRDDAGTGTPMEYAIFGGSVYFSPTPSATEANAVTHFFIKTLDELVSSGAGANQVTTSDVPEKFHYVLERGAEMLAFQMIGDDKRAQQAEIQFREGIERAKAEYTNMTNDYDSTLFTADQVEGDRLWRFSPYQ